MIIQMFLLDIKILNYNVTAQHVSHYATRIPPYSFKISKLKNKNYLFHI